MTEDDDFLDAEDDDGTNGVYGPGAEPDDDETVEMRPLFPDGVADDRWDGIFEEPD